MVELLLRRESAWVSGKFIPSVNIRRSEGNSCDYQHTREVERTCHVLHTAFVD